MVAPVNAVFPVLSETATVSANTQYVFSFYAKKGTAGNVTCGIYDNTNGANIVNPVSYVSLLSDTTLARISLAFTTPANCTSVSVFPVWYGTDYGSVTVYGMQLEVATITPSFPILLTESGDTLIAEDGSILTGQLVEDIATPYQLTLGTSLAAQGYTPQATDYSLVNKVKAIDILKSSEIVVPVARLRSIGSLRGYDKSTSTLVISKLRNSSIAKDTPSAKFNNTSSMVNKLITPANKFQLVALTTSNVVYPTPFQNSPNAGDFKFGVSDQSPRSITTSTTSLLQWYLEYGSQSDLLTNAISTNLTIKTFYFTPSAYTPFAVGSSIKVSNTNGNAYTATVLATDLSSVTIAMPAVEFPSGYIPANAGIMPSSQQAFTTPGTYTWTAPAGVTSVSVVAIGGGGAQNGNVQQGGAGGGGLGWKNNIPVIPGRSYTVAVGSANSNFGFGGVGGDSYFIDRNTVKGGGGAGNNLGVAIGGDFVGDGGGNGGQGAVASGSYYGGNGGAGGYTGNGGNGGTFSNSGTAGAGGGGGGGGGNGLGFGGLGGGVGIFGQGATGSAGGGSVSGVYPNAGLSGGSGSGGPGILYGGAGIGLTDFGHGAVRIIWGPGRIFPGTNTADIVGQGVSGTDATFGIFIESGATVYSKLLVAPTNRSSGLARDRLYYNNMSPGIKGYLSGRSNIGVQTSLTTSTGQLSKAFEIVKTVGNNVRSGQLQKSIEVIRQVSTTTFTVSKVNAAVVVRAVPSILLSNSGAPIIKKYSLPTAPFINFNISTRVAKVAAAAVLRADTSKLRVDKLNTVNVLKGVPSTTSTPIVSKFKTISGIVAAINTTMLSPTPFQNTSNPGDFKMFVVGQSPDATTTSTSSLLQWYLEYSANSDVLIISTATYTTSSVKTFYFGPTGYNPYSVGSIIKIGNIYGSSYTATVVSSSIGSVTIAMPGLALPSVGTYVETSATVYSQLLVAPTSRRSTGLARENLYFANLAPRLTFFTRDTIAAVALASNTGQLTKAIEVIKDVTNNVRSGQLQKSIEVIRQVNTATFRVANVKAGIIARGDRTRILASQVEKQKVPATNVGLFRLPPTIAKVSAAAVLRADTSKLQVDKLNTVNVLRTVPSIIKTSVIEKIKRPIEGPTFSITANNLVFPTPFQNSPNPGDFRMFVVGQSQDTRTASTSSLVQWYLEYGATSDILTISSATYTTSSIKTFYFAPTAYNPYSIGSSIKIANVYGTSYTATVIASSISSVTILKPYVELPSVGTYIESSATVYSQLLVAPTNRSSGLARDRLYYNNMGPGIKGYLAERSNVGVQTSLTTSTGQLSKAIEVIKDVTNNVRSGQLQKPFEIVKGTLTRTDVAKLNAAAIVRGENNKFNPSIISKFKTPTGQVFVVQPTVTQLQKAFEVVKGTPLKIDIAKLNAMNVVRGDRTRILASQVEKQKVPATNVVLFRLPPTIAKVSSVAVLRADTSKLTTNKLNTINTLKSVTSIIRTSVIEKIKRPIEGPTFSITANNLVFPTPFQNSPNPGDFRMFVTGQSAEVVTTSTASLVQWYLEYSASSDVLTVTTSTYSTSSVKTFYFTPTAYNPYSVGSSIKVANVYGSSYTATVIASSISSVTILKPYVEFPSVGTYIESSATVYSQLLVAPTNRSSGLARDRLYYNNMSSGIKGYLAERSNIGVQTSLTTSTGQLSKAFEIVKEARTTIRASQLQKPFEIIKGTLTRTDVAKLNAMNVVRGDRTRILASQVEKQKVPATNVGLFRLPPTIAKVSAAAVLTAEPSKLRTDKLNTTNVLRTIPSNFKVTIIEKIKRPIEGPTFSLAPNILFPTPFQNTPNPGDFKTFVTGQSQDTRTASTSSLVQWYLEYGATSDVLTISSATYTTSSIKTFYFSEFGYNPYSVGSSIKVGNIYGSVYTATVVSSSIRSVTVQTPPVDLPSVGTYIESSATVYSQLLVAPTNRGSGLARDRLYYNNMSPGIKGYLAERSNIVLSTLSPTVTQLQKRIEVVKDARTTLVYSQLQKAFEIVKGTLTRIDVAKLNATTVLRGVSTTTSTPIVTKFKTPTAQVFVVTPTVTQLQKAFEMVKDARTTLVYSQLQKPIEVVRSDRTVFTVNKVAAMNVLRGIKAETTSVSIITQVKMPVTRYVFSMANTYTNQVAKLTAAAVVRDTQSKLIYSQLQKAFETIRSVNVNAIAGNIFKVKQPLSPPFVFSMANTYTNQVAKLTAAAIVKEARVRLTVDKLTTANVLRGIKAETTSVSIITQVKMPVTRYVFSMANTYTNQVAKLTAAAVVRDARTTLAYSQLQKPIEAIRGIAVTTSTPIITRFKVPVVNFTISTGTGLAPKLTAASVLREARTTLTISQLPKQLVFLREARSISTVTNRLESTINTSTFIYAQTSVITKTAPKTAREALYYFYLAPDYRADHYQRLTNYPTVGVYNTPVQSGRVNAVNVLKGVTNNIQVARLKAINVLRDANTRIDIFGRLERRILLEANRITFLYTAASTSTTDISRLEQFDVGSYPGDFKLQIVGQNADYNNNLISWYFNQALYTPFSVGTRIKISSSGSNSILYYATVTSVTSNSVSFVKPNIDIPISNTYIEGGSSVYPRSFVQPSTYPTNARERLYFFELAPAIRDANKYQSTLINRQTVAVNNISTVTNRLESTINTGTFIYAQALVRPSIYPPKNARETLYFFELAPALRDANKYQNTIITRFAGTPIEVPRIISANINFRTRVQLFNTVQNGNLQKAFEIVRGDTIRNFVDRIERQKIYASGVQLFSLSTTVYQLPKAFEIVKGSREVPLISLLSKYKVNKDRVQLFNTVQNGNLSKAFEIVKDVFNTFKLPYAQVIRLKTGDGKNGQRGVQDPTFRKKAPIQFWN